MRRNTYSRQAGIDVPQVEVVSRDVYPGGVSGGPEVWEDTFDGVEEPVVWPVLTRVQAAVNGETFYWEGFRRVVSEVSFNRVAIVGEAPPRRHARAFDDDSGDRLAGYVGVTPDELRAGVIWGGPTLLNLYAEAPVKWNAARAKVQAVRQARRYALWSRSVVLLCGGRVATAFGVTDTQVFECVRVDLGLRYPLCCVRIPSPSRRNRWWGTADNRLEAAVFFAIMLGRAGL